MKIAVIFSALVAAGLVSAIPVDTRMYSNKLLFFFLSLLDNYN